MYRIQSKHGYSFFLLSFQTALIFSFPTGCIIIIIHHCQERRHALRPLYIMKISSSHGRLPSLSHRIFTIIHPYLLHFDVVLVGCLALFSCFWSSNTTIARKFRNHPRCLRAFDRVKSVGLRCSLLLALALGPPKRFLYYVWWCRTLWLDKTNNERWMCMVRLNSFLFLARTTSCQSFFFCLFLCVTSIWEE